MMQSMTGFGRGGGRTEGVAVSVEIRALNSRQPDVRFKLPQLYRSLEIQLRNRLQESTKRGKIDVTVERRGLDGSDLDQEINRALYTRYSRELVELTPALADDPGALATAVLRLPNVVGAPAAEVADDEAAAVVDAFDAALADFVSFRQAEGEALRKDLLTHVLAISESIPRVEQYEADRQVRMRQRLERLIEENASGTAVDQNRLEQELLFYLEKMDISEEKARLAQHCEFFQEKLNDDELEKGRRLNFIGQEMGREINTLGAKAYSSDLQKVVVHMKEELEKIKEQLANAV